MPKQSRISPKTVLAIAEVFEGCFEFIINAGGGKFEDRVRPDWFADLLFEKEHPKALIDYVRRLPPSRGVTRAVIVGLYDGSHSALVPTIAAETDEARRVEMRDALMQKLADDILEYGARSGTLVKPNSHEVKQLVAALAEDGYTVRNGRVVLAEEDPVDVAKEADELRRLFAEQSSR